MGRKSDYFKPDDAKMMADILRWQAKAKKKKAKQKQAKRGSGFFNDRDAKLMTDIEGWQKEAKNKQLRLGPPRRVPFAEAEAMPPHQSKLYSGLGPARRVRASFRAGVDALDSAYSLLGAGGHGQRAGQVKEHNNNNLGRKSMAKPSKIGVHTCY